MYVPNMHIFYIMRIISLCRYEVDNLLYTLIYIQFSVFLFDITEYFDGVLFLDLLELALPSKLRWL